MTGTRTKATGRGSFVALLAAALTVTLVPAAASDSLEVHATPQAEGPLPGSPPGDPDAEEIEDTYPFFATYLDLDAQGYVEEEFLVSGEATAFDSGGTVLEAEVPYTTRIVVRRPERDAHFNGAVLAEWQNVTAGYDLDALWGEQLVREGYTWVGVSAQRVGVDQLREWSPARYGDRDVTGGGTYTSDELSYDINAQIGQLLGGEDGPLSALDVDTVLSIGASQSTRFMSTYYDHILPGFEPVFDGYGFIVGTAPSREGNEPVFHVLAEGDVSGPMDRPDTDQYRLWQVAGAAHSGWAGQEYRAPLSERDLGGAPEYNCQRPPFSRVPMHHVTAAAYGHLAAWAEDGTAPPIADRLEFDSDGSMVRDELGHARGGIQLSQVEVPTALNTGHGNAPGDADSLFCGLFGVHEPFDDQTLDELYRNHGQYVSSVVRVDNRNVRDGFLLRGDSRDNRTEAATSDVGR